MDANNVERIEVAPLGGADTITVNDLTGTDVKQVAIDLGGVADGQIDTIIINTPNANDAITVSNDRGVVKVSGLATELTISNFEANDRIIINGEVIDATQNAAVATVNSDGTGATSTAIDGSRAASLALLAQHMASSFVTAGGGHGETLIVDSLSIQQPLLTQPHA
jgi:hypothetical protein